MSGASGLGKLTGVVTLCAAERPFTWMGQHVRLEGSSCRARVIALSAAERLFPRVGHHVYLEFTSCCEGEITLCASESPFAWMGQHVSLEVSNLSASVIALRTTERLFPGMGQHVCLEVSSTGARIITLHAVESLFTTLMQHIRIQIISHFDWVSDSAWALQPLWLLAFQFFISVLCCRWSQLQRFVITNFQEYAHLRKCHWKVKVIISKKTLWAPATSSSDGRFTLFEASLLRCFAFYKISSETSGGNVLKTSYKTSHRWRTWFWASLQREKIEQNTEPWHHH